MDASKISTSCVDRLKRTMLKKKIYYSVPHGFGAFCSSLIIHTLCFLGMCDTLVEDFCKIISLNVSTERDPRRSSMESTFSSLPSGNGDPERLLLGTKFKSYKQPLKTKESLEANIQSNQQVAGLPHANHPGSPPATRDQVTQEP